MNRMAVLVTAAGFTLAASLGPSAAEPPSEAPPPTVTPPTVTPPASKPPVTSAPGKTAAEAPAGERPVALLPGLGHHHHPITARIPEAQAFFNQGLVLAFAFNDEEAVRSFKRAAFLDSQAAMALWGVAWALGPDVDRPRDAGRDGQARDAIAKAQTLAKNGPDLEHAYIDALAKRFSADPKADPAALDAAYRDAMKDLVARWPDDLDATALYAESLLALHPAAEWWRQGTPSPETAEAIAVLESLLRRAPEHPAANRDYILALEASPYPERALASALRLETLVPLAGGLLHAPAHVYVRTGDYAAAARTNEKAVEADEALFRDFGRTPRYALTRYPHTLLSLAAARAMEGRGSDAVRAAQEVRAAVTPALALKPLPPDLVPAIDALWQAPLMADLRFRKWDDILKEPEPDARLVVSAALRHAARAIACAGKRDWACAESAKSAFGVARAAVRSETAFGTSLAQDVLNVALFVLDGRLLEARGRRDDAIASWRSAAQAQDALAHDEPPDWYYPTRESLGGALLRSGRAQEAEKVFREDLDRNPRNGRSLFGLWKCLDAEKKPDAAALVKEQLDDAWKDADVTLKVEDL